MALPSGFYGGSSAGGAGFYGGGGGGDVGGGGLGDYSTSPTDPSELTPHKMLQGVVRLLRSNDPNDQAQARKYLLDNEQEFTDSDLAEYGIQRPHQDGRSLFQKAVGSGLSGLQIAGGILGRPQQIAAHALKTVGTTIGGEIGYGVHALSGGGLAKNYEGVGLGDIFNTQLRNLKETGQAATSITGKHDINSREMLGLDKNLGGDGWVGKYLVGGADLAGVMATDPLSYAGTHGAKEATQAGLRAFEKVEPGLAQKIISHGAEAVTDEQIGRALGAAKAEAERVGAGQRGRLTSFLMGSAEKTGGPFARFKEGALLGAAGQDAREGLSRYAPKGLGTLLTEEFGKGPGRAAAKDVLNALARGQEGYRFGGQTILPKLGRRSVFSALGLTSKIVERDNPLAARLVDSMNGLADEHAAIVEKQAQVGKPGSKVVETVEELEQQKQQVVQEWRKQEQTMRELIYNSPTEEHINPEAEAFRPQAMFGELEQGPQPPLRPGEQEYNAARERHVMEAMGKDPSIMNSPDRIAAVGKEFDDAHTRLRQDIYWHGDQSGQLPEKLHGRDMIDAVDNYYGPGTYTSGDKGLAQTYSAFEDVGGKTNLHNMRWEGDKAPKFFDLDAMPKEGEHSIPDEIRSFMKRNLEHIREQGGPDPELDDALAQMDQTGVNAGKQYRDWKKALMSASHGNVIDHEMLDGYIRDVTDLFEQHGYDGFYHEGGWATGGTKHPVRIIFDPTKLSHVEEPGSVTLATGMSPEYYDEARKFNKLKAQREEVMGKLASAKSEAFNSDTEAVQAKVDDMAGAIEQHGAGRIAHRNAGRDIRRLERNWSAADQTARDAKEKYLELHNNKPGGPSAPITAEERAAQEDAAIAIHKKLLVEDELNAARDTHSELTRTLRPDAKIEELKVQHKALSAQLKTMRAADNAQQAELEATRAANESKSAGLAALKAGMPDQVPVRIKGKLTPLGDTVRGLFKTDSGLALRHGEQAKGAMQSIEETAQGTATQEGEAYIRAIENTQNKAMKESKDFAAEMSARVYPAMETPGGAAALIDEYKAADRPEAAKYVKTLDDIRKSFTATRQGLGLLDAGAHDVDTYMQRLLTGDAAKTFREYKAAQRAGEVAQPQNALLRDLGAEGTANAREVGKNLPVGPELQDLGRKAMQELDPSFDMTKDVYKQQPSLSTASSAVQASRQKAQVEVLNKLADVKDVHGAPLLTRDEETAKALGYELMDAPGGKVYAPPAVRTSLGRFNDVMTNDESLAAMKRALNKTMRIWKAQATVPLIGAAFHARNAETNVMLNWIAGLENPVWYARSARIQMKVGKVAKMLGEEGVTMRDVLEKGNFTSKEKLIIKGAMEDGVLQANYVGHGLESGEAVGSRLEDKNIGPLRKTARKAKFWNTDQALGVRSGRWTGRTIENNARLAHYMWALDTYGDAATAANSVRKYLFDYNDLTPFERNLKENYIPFYTFMRKNVGLMADTLKDNPGKLRRFTMAEAATRDENAPWLKNKLIPNYQILGGQGGQAARRGGLFSHQITSIESPLGAAVDTVMPLAQTAKLTPGLGKLLPDAVANPEGGSGIARDLLNLPGGPPAQALRALTGKAYDVDTFTGGYAPRQGAMDKVLAATDIFAVSPSKIARTIDKLGLNGASMADLTDLQKSQKRNAALVNLFTGLNASPVNDSTTKQEEKNRWYQAIKDYTDKHNRGLAADDPRRILTLDELELLGRIPPSTSGRGGLGTY